MATVAVIVGAAIVNAIAFTTGNALYDKFALWIDLRSTQDIQLHGTGKSQMSDKNDITLAIQKKREGNNENARYFMHAYIVTDARINIENKKLKTFDL